MKLHIQSAPNCDQDALRALLLDASDELIGTNGELLEPKLPWDGYPILLADAQGHPVLVSFDNNNSQAALLNGLNAIEQLAVALAWVNQVYPALGQQQKAPKLVVVGRTPPPGAGAVLAGCPGMQIFTYKVLRVNDDTGIWLERIDPESVPSRPGDVRTEPPAITAVVDNKMRLEPRATDEPGLLTEAERAYFQQL